MNVGVIKGNRYARNLTTAIMLAEEQIELLRTNGFDQLRNGAFRDSDNPMDALGQPCPPGELCIFERSWAISDYRDRSDIKEVVVTISWLSKQESMQLNAVMTDTL